jgi:hypothetical protein
MIDYYLLDEQGEPAQPSLTVGKVHSKRTCLDMYDLRARAGRTHRGRMGNVNLSE